MKKFILIPLISVLSSSFAHAGGMGGYNSSCCSGFVSLEGGYTWSSIDGYNFSVVGSSNTLTSTQDEQGYTARLAVGVLSMIDDQYGITGEVGWGYYGKTTINPSISDTFATLPAALNIEHTLSGFDALLGISYIQNYFTLYGKAGALIQNMQTSSTAYFTPTVFPVVDSFSLKTNRTAVLPTIKLGVAYNIDSNWSITGSYLLAVGASPGTSGVFNPVTLRSSLTLDDQNPMMNTALLGIQYTA
ncbi:membrane protein [Legionella norrlandica]|uniref:Membrane protein n=1 Tax=Legionella norrlandica TaxID=1498499 RepID=A0A0A2SRF0_9GAMM|nr:outer membrane beta-barrel protein [Legionella norrlandica]KGP63317.1 membrane protein [Legionella norrlandica]